MPQFTGSFFIQSVRRFTAYVHKRGSINKINKVTMFIKAIAAIGGTIELAGIMTGDCMRKSLRTHIRCTHFTLKSDWEIFERESRYIDRIVFWRMDSIFGTHSQQVAMAEKCYIFSIRAIVTLTGFASIFSFNALIYLD